MKISFLVARNGDSLGSLDSSQLAQTAVLVVQVDDSSQGIDEIVSVCFEKKPDSVVLIAREPLRFRDDRRMNLTRQLVSIGINPASIGFVNFNGIVLCADSEEEIAEHLLLTTALAHDRVAHSSPLSMEKVSPVKRCLVIGDVAESESQILKDNGIELVSIWADQEGSPGAETVLNGLSGLPGKYLVDLSRGTEVEECICGAVIVKVEFLDADRKKQIAEVMKIPLPGGEFSLPPDRHVLTNGVWIAGRGNGHETAKWPEEVSSFLHQNTVELYLDTCTVDLSKCGLCGTCVKTCMFAANSIDVGIGKIHFDQTRCTGCGNCVTACPVLARDLHHYSNSYMAKIADSLKEFQGRDGVKILALFCENNGYKAVNHITAAGKRVSSSYYFLPVKCGARIGTEIIPDSFRAGFDGVALLVCARDECNDLVGSLDLERRFNLYRTIMKAQAQESGRMRIFSIKQDELANVYSGLEQFAGYLRDLQADQVVFAEL
jgi:coenzyme F420-reducing hydrogenase delta subunit/Pyruvate/2-oxoacid:ferredoxin oxidoreductase delta subunit